MERWEYRKFEIYLEDGEYIARYDSGYPEMRGWDAIMDHWTDHGWELVSLAPLEFERPFLGSAFLGSDRTYKTTRFLAVWKRPRTAQGTPTP